MSFLRKSLCIAFLAATCVLLSFAPASARARCTGPSKKCIVKQHRILSSGDTLERIANTYRVRVSELMRWNPHISENMPTGTLLNIYYTPQSSVHRLRAHKGTVTSRPRLKALPRALPTHSPHPKESDDSMASHDVSEDFDIDFVYEDIATLAKPYPLKWILRGFGKCVDGKREHQAIDIAGVGPNFGLGTPVRAMTQSSVVSIGLPEDNPRRFGVRDTRPGKIVRKGRELPRGEEVPGYGHVNYFTLDHGSWRTGVLLVTKGMDGDLDGHQIRYMHMAALHPSIKVGTILEPGDEIGLMGSTAILESPPHVHIDVTDPRGHRVDVRKLLGLPSQEYAQCESDTEHVAHNH